MNLDLRRVAEEHRTKLEKIKIALFDVDGILTDGLLSFQGETLGFNRTTHIQDGFGLKMLMRAGIKVGVISGGDSLGVWKRFKENLGLNYVYLGHEDKRDVYLNILKEGFQDQEVLYMGDEFIDLPILKRVGFSVTVPNASMEIREVVDYISHRPSGKACVREVVDVLRYAQGIVPEIKDFEEQ